MINISRALAMIRLGHVILVAVLGWALRAPDATAQHAPLVTYNLEKGSRLYLSGTATIGDYSCEALHLDGAATFAVDSASKHDGPTPDTANCEVRVSVSVKKIECGNSAMNEDMYAAMKADSFPSIQYELWQTTIWSEAEKTDSIRHLSTNGTLTIAGVAKIIPMEVTIRQLSSVRYQIVGSKTLSMRSFGINAPSALWGLIRANDELVVHFDLIAAMKKVDSVKERKE